MGIFLPYPEAAVIVQSQNFKNRQEFKEWGNKPIEIPIAPDQAYRDKGWISWGVFLGTGIVANQQKGCLSYNDAQKIVAGKGFSSASKFRAWETRPENIPSNPNRSYKNKGWISWDHFLGK